MSDKDIENIAAFYSVQKSRPAENGQRLIEDLTEKCGRCHAGNVDNPDHGDSESSTRRIATIWSWRSGPIVTTGGKVR